MKYVESTDLDVLSSQLTFLTPEAHVVGGVDLYTTKPATSDRKLQRVLDQALDARAYEDEAIMEEEPAVGSLTDVSGAGTLIPGSVGSSHSGEMTDGPILLSPPSSLDKKRRTNSASLPASPFGPLDQVASRKQYAYLISVLNANDPDRDFSALQPDMFQREISTQRLAAAVSSLLHGLGTRPPSNLWEIIDKHIDIKDSRIYSLALPQQFLQDEPGALWSRMWFFFNKRRKRVVFFHMKGTRIYSPIVKPDPGAEIDEEYDLYDTLEEPVVGALD